MAIKKAKIQKNRSASIRSQKFKYINQSVNIADTHFGCQLALCLPEVPLDNGGTYKASKVQLKLYNWWDEFWGEWVPLFTKGEPFATVHVGDINDGRHHNATTQISQNLADQQKLAESFLKPIVDASEGRFYVVRGTGAHSGEAGENEEKIAQAVGAIPDTIGNYARNDLWLRLGGPDGTLVNYLHHIGVSSTLGYEGTALNKEFEKCLVEAARWRYPPPDFVIRAHRHRHWKTQIATRNVYGIGEILPGWQLKTPLVWRVGGNTTAQCGGVLIRKGDREHYSVEKVFNVDRTPEEIAVEIPKVVTK